MIAPTFPDAAEMPWAEARKRVGKTERKYKLVKGTFEKRKRFSTFSWVTLERWRKIRNESLSCIHSTYVGSTIRNDLTSR